MIIYADHADDTPAFPLEVDDEDVIVVVVELEAAAVGEGPAPSSSRHGGRDPATREHRVRAAADIVIHVHVYERHGISPRTIAIRCREHTRQKEPMI